MPFKFDPEVLKKHPNTKYLKPMTDSETAREAQKKGVEQRRMNKEFREALKLTAESYNKLKAELPEMNSLDYMRATMLAYIQEGNTEEALRIAAIIAPYENAKLSAVEQTVKTDTTKMTDDELRSIVNLHLVPKSNQEDAA